MSHLLIAPTIPVLHITIPRQGNPEFQRKLAKKIAGSKD